MVMRSNSNDSATRAQSSASRATLRELNSDPFWSEAKHLDVMASETHTDVEFAENYGSTSVPAKQDEDEQGQGQGKQDSGGGGDSGGAGGGGAGTQGEEGEQPQGDAAEAIVLYLNGSRSHPVIISMGDRRHRLTGLEPGDYANHRLKDDRQQFLLSKDGTYLSTRNDKVMRIALVDPKDTGSPKPKQQQSSTPSATQQAASGGSSSGTGQQGQGKQEKKYGQKSAKDDNKSSKISFQQDKKATTISHNDGKSQQTGDDSTAYHGDKTKSVQATADHAHLRTGGNRIFTDKGGCWSTVPIQQKKDGHCKE